MNDNDMMTEVLKYFRHTEKNSLVKFVEPFKSWGYRHLRNQVLEYFQNFSE